MMLFWPPVSAIRLLLPNAKRGAVKGLNYGVFELGNSGEVLSLHFLGMRRNPHPASELG